MTCRELNTTNPDIRAQLEDDILYMVENDITFILVFFTPTFAPDKLIGRIEKAAMSYTRQVMAAITTEDLESEDVQRFLIRLAVGYTWRLINKWVTL